MLSFLQKENNVWQTLKDCGQPVVLYGMGDGADKVLRVFERFGIQPAAVMASDAFVRGQRFHGFTVQKMSDLEETLGEFTVALCFASQLPDVMAHIREVACRHRLLVPPVAPFGDVLFDDAFVQAYEPDIRAAEELMADEQSRRVYRAVLRFYHSGEIGLLDDVTTGKDEAFRTLLRLGGNEVYVDLGAYNGDTIEEFLRYADGSYRKIVALEPNAKNFAKLQASCGGLPRTELWQLGAWNKNTTLIFNNKAGRNSAVADKGVETHVAAVDSILCGTAATYVKADVEGADREALLGMEKTLRLFAPKLNLAAYHRFEDIFRLPLLVHRLNPRYQIYLRHHPYIPAWDTNLYCVKK